MANAEKKPNPTAYTVIHGVLLALFLLRFGWGLWGETLWFPHGEGALWCASFGLALLRGPRRVNEYMAAGMLGLCALLLALRLGERPPVTDSERVAFFVFSFKLLLLLGLTALGEAALTARRDVTRLYAPAALLLGLFMLFAVTPLSAPDEQAHYECVFQLSQRLLGQREYNPAYFDFSGLSGHFNVSSGYLRLMDGLFSPLPEGKLLPWPERGIAYFPEYLPQTVGLTLARLLGGNFLTALLLGRFTNLLFFIGCLALAIRTAPEEARHTLGLMGLLPITLQQCASLSYDSFILGLSLLLLAQILCAARERGPISLPRLGGIFLCAVLLAPTRAVYAVLSALLWLIPAGRFGGKGRRGLTFVLLLFLCAGAAVLAQYNTMAAMGGGGASLNWEGGQNYTLPFILAHPGRTAGIFLRTLRELLLPWLLEAHGGTLSGLSLRIHRWIPAGFALLLLLSVSAREEGERPDWRERVLLLATAAAVVLGTMGAMLLGWTSDTRDVIAGVQGRYFLPVLPLGYLALGNGFLLSRRDKGRYLLWAGAFLSTEALFGVLNYTLFM